MNHVQQIPVCRRYDPRLNGYVLNSADWSNFFFLQHAKELGLQVKRQLPDLIQKESTVASLYKETGFVPISSCERPFHMAEKLRFQEIGRKRGAIYCTKTADRLAGAAVNNRASNSFPVPLSPKIRTFVVLCATFSARASNIEEASLRVIISDSDSYWERFSLNDKSPVFAVQISDSYAP